jgi:outer membrane protein OmpA-like peptidoglycan-associated protein
MKMSIRAYLVLSLAIVLCDATAQSSASALEFFNGSTHCATSLGGWKCLELDLTSELTGESDTTKVYEYSWNFGDGTRKHGTKTEHCYETFGQYQVSLDLIDKEASTVIRNELSATVFLYPEIFPLIRMSTENVPPSFMQFSCAYDHEDFAPDHVYWRINGDYYEGSTVVHAFPVAGMYLVEVGVEKDMEFLGTVSACASVEVTVKESNVWTTNVMKNINKVREETNAGPYASADVICFIKTLGSENRESVHIPLHSLMGQAKLKEDHLYEISMFAGNIFSSRKILNTKGVSGNDLYIALKDAVVELAAEPFTSLSPVKFGAGQTELNADEVTLKNTADLLARYPYLQIEIGSYIHTGSRIAKAVPTSLLRASMVKDALVKHGITPERISIASPEYNRALINSCSAVPNCKGEDPRLNGMVEFKITGTML